MWENHKPRTVLTAIVVPRIVRRIVVAGMLSAIPLLLCAASKGFRNEHQLDDHFSRYGRDFGHPTKAQYLKMAQQLRDARPSKDVLLKRRLDGGGAKFDVRVKWFVAFDADGTIRTFFVPKDGMKYFDRFGEGPPPE